jgi:multidrug resistance efflux pump
MDSLNVIQDLISALQPPAANKPPAADGPLAGFEQAIDRIVAEQNQASKAVAQASLQKAKLQAERLEAFERRRALLVSQVQQAQVAVSALEGSRPSVEESNQLLDFKKQEVAYWEGKLRQASPPGGTGDALSSTLEP